MSALISAILLEVGCLAPLHPWEPVGTRLEALLEASQGRTGVSAQTLLELRSWATTWRALFPQVREFYLKRVPDLDERNDTARVALWTIFKGGPRLEGWQYGRLYELWAEDYGDRPRGIEIAPVSASLFPRKNIPPRDKKS